jgi:hypothetical protein
MNDYPEHNKLRAIQPFSQKIGEFLDWLEEQKIELVMHHEHSSACEDENGDHKCGYCNGEEQPIYESKEKMLARFFEIDLKKLDMEKEEMLNQIREENTRK